MRLSYIFALVFFTLMKEARAQDISVRGVVAEEMQDGKINPLAFAQVYWLQSKRNTTTDTSGYFFIAHGKDDGEKLIFAYTGYQPDTILVVPGKFISVVFQEQQNVLGEVVVSHKKRTTEVSFLDPLQLQNISKEELFKAACCNLSESFETNATVDVSFTDAITGAKEIQMLGLSGKYSLISQEQSPGISGLAIPYGLLYTPGAWIESIQISKGAGSVIQGYESMTGQINVELRKPHDGDKFLINGFFNDGYRSELNAFQRVQLSHMLSTAFFGHISSYPKKLDRNKDGFADSPKGNLITLDNRWDYHNEESHVEAQLNVQWLRDRKQGGHVAGASDVQEYYPVEINADRIQVLGKLGYVFPNKRYASLGSQYGYTNHQQTALIGNNLYVGHQTSFSGNWLFQSILSDTRHQYFTGISFRYNNYDEVLNSDPYAFKEIVPGAFFEYSYKPDEKFTLVAGVRVDKHNLYGWLLNPRLHLRYAPSANTVIRLSGGRGMRTSLPIAENLGALASSRQWRIPGQKDGDEPYGLNMEKAWNVGASLNQEFKLDYRNGLVSLDFFRTMFTDRTIVDLDISPQELWIYNLEGSSYANTFQAELQYELLKRLDAKVAYKLQDSRITYRDAGLRKQIFTPASRFFANLSYVSSVATYKGHWRISLTGHYTGTQRIPDTDSNPSAFQLS
ncbi:MAG: TonB-dependent receptor, partial [Saprospiraceae bacterium]